jgi:hypothetical protein
MPEETAPVAEQDQPTDVPVAPEAEDQPAGDAEESFVDSYNPNDVPEEARPQLEAAYKQLQAAYTEKTQGLAKERQEAEQAREIVQALADPTRAPEVLKFFGLELEPDQEEDDFPLDPDERLDQMEANFAQWQQQQAEAQQAAAAEDELIKEIEGLEGAAGREFTEKEIRVLSGRESDPKVLHGLMEEIRGEDKKQWEEDLRKGKTAPRRPGSGTPASKAVDLSKLSGRELREARDQLAAEAAEEAIAAEG